ncbi:MAG: AmmeMemoRadiSam system protein B [Ignavibacteria bacterium]|nr:AmmeMemoRadiSam system protein B [Ignavibacteria bacterium]
MKEKIRKPVCAGTWYSDDPDELSHEIDGYLENAAKENLNVKAVVVPHAGYMFSGQTAAISFRQISDKIKTVIILGTSHRYPLRGACIIDYDFYSSPLGRVKLSDKVKSFLKEKEVVSIPAADNNEHSIEIEIPFLQRALKDFTIIPVVVGEVDAAGFSKILEKYYDENTLIVVSVDLSHFNQYDLAVKLDTFSINSILELNAENIKFSEIDSPHAVMALIHLAERKKWKTKLLDYRNSGDVVHDRSSVVGYSSIIFYEDDYE